MITKPRVGCNKLDERRDGDGVFETMTSSIDHLSEVSGSFFRTVPLNRIDRVLEPPHAESAGRYHRHGQPALYMSPHQEWARIAVSGYMRDDGQPRAVVPLTVTRALVLDQRDPEACRKLGFDRELSNRSWLQALRQGETPPSWSNSDFARSIPADGIIDVSRHIADGWHLILFQWNEAGAPVVAVSGEPTIVHPTRTGPKWG